LQNFLVLTIGLVNLLHVDSAPIEKWKKRRGTKPYSFEPLAISITTAVIIRTSSKHRRNH